MNATEELIAPNARRAPRALRRAILCAIPIVTVLAVMFAIRIPLLTAAGVVRGWSSDSAIIAMMGKKIYEGRGFDIFFWGQNYLGPLSALYTAAAAVLVRILHPSENIWPLASRIGSIACYASGVVFYWLGFRHVSERAAVIVAIFLAIGPPFYFHDSVISYGPEMAFLLGGLLFWIGAGQLTASPGRGPLDSSAGRFAFGLVAGLGWWMNQGVVFSLAGIVWVLVMRASWYPAFRAKWKIADRLLVHTERLGWEPLASAARFALLGVESLALIQIVLFVIDDLAPLPFNLFFLYSPLLEPLLVVVVLQFVLAVRGGELRISLHGAKRGSEAAAGELPRPSQIHRGFRLIVPVAIGAVIGYAPVWLGGMLGWYERSYSFYIDINYPRGLFVETILTFTRALPELIGAGAAPLGALWGAGVVVLLGWSGWRNRREVVAFIFQQPARWGVTGLASAIFTANLVFFCIGQRPLGKMHYLIAALPMAFGVLSIEIEAAARLGKRQEFLMSVLLLLGIGSLALGARTVTGSILSEPDPMRVVRSIEREGYRVCYADFWVAYKAEFLSGGRIRFIPYLSQDRTRRESAALEALPVPKCIVRSDGTVARFTAADVPTSVVTPRR
ncbi:MAG: hypothetical protein WBX15_08760 [Thermoanaerobaculia bacterium]